MSLAMQIGEHAGRAGRHHGYGGGPVAAIDEFVVRAASGGCDAFTRDVRFDPRIAEHPDVDDRDLVSA